MVRKILPEEVTYLRERKYPYIDISATGYSDDVEIDSLIDTRSALKSLMGWPVIYSPCEPLINADGKFVPADVKEHAHILAAFGADSEEEFNPDFQDKIEGGVDDARYNSISQRTFKTAGEIILLTLEQGWAGVKINEGTDLFKWCLWAAAKANNLPVTGYDLADDEETLARYERSESLLSGYVLDPQKTYTPKLGPTEASAMDEVLNAFPPEGITDEEMESVLKEEAEKDDDQTS